MVGDGRRTGASPARGERIRPTRINHPPPPVQAAVPALDVVIAVSGSSLAKRIETDECPWIEDRGAGPEDGPMCETGTRLVPGNSSMSDSGHSRNLLQRIQGHRITSWPCHRSLGLISLDIKAFEMNSRLIDGVYPMYDLW